MTDTPNIIKDKYVSHVLLELEKTMLAMRFNSLRKEARHKPIDRDEVIYLKTAIQRNIRFICKICRIDFPLIYDEKSINEMIKESAKIGGK